MAKSEKILRARTMWFCTNCYALDGSEILTLNMAKDICEQHATQIEKYVINLHDIDTHDEQSIAERDGHRKQTYMEIYKKLAKSRNVPTDSESESGFVYDAGCEHEAHFWSNFYYPAKKVGDAKELHVHVALKFKNARALNEIAKWFGIPENMIDIVKGRHAFEDCAEYMVHKKQPEKAQYDPAKVIANFNYVEWLENQVVKDILHEKYHMNIDDINDIVNEVATAGLSLQKVEEMVSAPIFLRNKKLFKDARAKYIYDHMSMPSVRFVFYVDSAGVAGAGKSVATKALCKQFAREYGADPTVDIGQLKQYIYKVGQKGVAWDKYDGQPIVFIDDRTARDLLQEFNGHEGVKNLFERFPEKETTNIKYGDACIVAKYIVINGIQPYVEFVNGLNGTFTTKSGIDIESDTDITQYTRRITGIINISEDEIAILFNKGVMSDTREFNQYVIIKTVKHNFVRAIQKLSGTALNCVEERTLQPVIETTKAIENNVNNKIDNPADIPSEFWDYGTQTINSDYRDFKVHG